MASLVVRAALAAAALAATTAAAAHTGADAGAHHGVLGELVHGLETIDPLLALALAGAAAIVGGIGLARKLRRG